MNPIPRLEELTASAIAVRENAYTPYSHYRVGAALLTKSGTIYTGCNVENAAYGPTICAERTAALKAISEGEREFEQILVVTENVGYPCGVCRQFLYEFNPDLRIIIADAAGKVHDDVRLSSLLPHGFGAEFLP